MRRVEVLAAARSLDGSDDALCRHSLPSRTLTLSLRPTLIHLKGGISSISKKLYIISRRLYIITQSVYLCHTLQRLQ